jgi:subtilisin family serine protease
MRLSRVRHAALLGLVPLLAAAPAAAQGSCYGFLRFPSPPTEAEKQEFSRQGVHVLSFFKEDLHRVRLTPCQRGEPLEESTGTFIRQSAESRVRTEIWNGAFDNYLVRLPDSTASNYVVNEDGTLNLTVTFNEGVAEAAMAAVIQEHADSATRIAGSDWLIRIRPAALPRLAEEEVVQWIDAGPMPFLPDNDRTRNALGVDAVQRFDMATGAAAGLAGRGIRVGIFDSGVDEGHDDLQARVVVNDGTFHYHGTHVAGILGGTGTLTTGVDARGKPVSGARYQWRGMAPLAEMVDARRRSADSTQAFLRYITGGMDLSNHSYSLTFDGQYERFTAIMDGLIRGDQTAGSVRVPPRLQVYSAGNHGQEISNGGTQTGYFALTKQMKNALVVGNVRLLPSTGAPRPVIDPSSSLGPTHDGRIKPDVVAPGAGISSTGYCDAGDRWDRRCAAHVPGTTVVRNYYRVMSGTSMATPAVSGVLALVLEQYGISFGVNVNTAPPRPASLRAVIIHTAADVVFPVLPQANRDGPVQAFPGPDFVTGWGMVRADEAIALVQRREILERTLGTTCDSIPLDFDVAPGGAVRITLAWDDVAADPGVESRTAPRLVNDLDLVLVDPDGRRHRPWLLDQVAVDELGEPVPDDLQTCGTRLAVLRSVLPVGVDAPQPDPLKDALRPAGRGRDHLNNVEQVLVDNPAPGRWRAWVIGYSVPEGPQPFSVIGIPAAP